MTQAILTTMADNIKTYIDIGFVIGRWVIPALLAVWAIAIIVKKIMQGIKGTKGIDQKIKEPDTKKKGQTKENDEGNMQEQLKELKEQNKKLADKIDKLEKGASKKGRTK